MTVKQMTQIAMLSSLCVVLRFSFGAFPNIKPITAIFLVCLAYFSLWEVALIMGLTMLVTSFYLGFGIWVFWQIIAYMVVLWLWKYLLFPIAKRLQLSMPIVAILSGIMPFIYSFVIGVFSSVTYGMNFWAYMLNGLFFDVLHGLSTVFFYPIVFYILRRFFTHEKIID